MSIEENNPIEITFVAHQNWPIIISDEADDIDGQSAYNIAMLCHNLNQNDFY